LLSLITLRNHADAQHAGIEKWKWLRAGMPELILLYEAALHLHTVIEITDKNPSNIQI